MNKSAVIPFVFADQPVRALTIEGNPWFVARDVCDILELSHITNALSGLDDDELTVKKLQSGGQEREMKLISESGLYTLIIRSNKPQAKAFRKWVTAEVLPAIRKSGFYASPGAGSSRRTDIHHHRGPVTDSGLDIRFQLDLTKIVLRPSPASLRLLQRITGVDVEDLIETLSAKPPASGDEATDLLGRYLGERLRQSAFGRLPLADVCRDYNQWRLDAGGAAMGVRELAKVLRAMGYSVVKRGGEVVVSGYVLEVV